MLKKVLIACVILILGCAKDNDFIYDVPVEFEPHVDRFIQEAKAGGKDITIDNLIIKKDSTLHFCIVRCQTQFLRKTMFKKLFQ